MAIGKRIHGLYGVTVDVRGAQGLFDAATAGREAGYTEMDAFSPFPIHGLHEAVGMHKTRLPIIVLIGGIIGGLSGFFMCYYANVISYPLNIGGKPLNSWAGRVSLTFECTILLAPLADRKRVV